MVYAATLEMQYSEAQKYDPETWKAFLRRIHEVQVYYEFGKKNIYSSVDEYFSFKKLTPAQATQKLAEVNQLKLKFDGKQKGTNEHGHITQNGPSIENLNLRMKELTLTPIQLDGITLVPPDGPLKPITPISTDSILTLDLKRLKEVQEKNEANNRKQNDGSRW